MTPKHDKNPVQATEDSKKSISWKAQATVFRASGFDYRQIVRSGDVAIYEQTRAGCPGFLNYEIVRIKRHDGYEIAGTTVAPSEYYPSSESWGIDGFTVTTRDKAFDKLKEMLA